jgi:hypothetical protein
MGAPEMELSDRDAFWRASDDLQLILHHGGIDGRARTSRAHDHTRYGAGSAQERRLAGRRRDADGACSDKPERCENPKEHTP